MREHGTKTHGKSTVGSQLEKEGSARKQGAARHVGVFQGALVSGVDYS